MIHFKDQRKKVSGKTKKTHYSAVCIGAMQHFLQSLPSSIVFFEEKSVLSEKKVRIAFASKQALQLLQECDLTSFLMDFTFSTNVEGLLLGGVGPVGLYLPGAAISSSSSSHTLPSMRFVPAIFMLSDAEDQGRLKRTFCK